MNAQSPSLSVVVPVYNEAESIEALYQQLADAAKGSAFAWEFLFIDDSSRDGTWDALTSIHARDPRLRAIRFTRNFGQTAAMACGIHANDGLLESGEKDASTVDVASVSDPRDEDACSFPIKDHAVVTDPISKARLRRSDGARSSRRRLKRHSCAIFRERC